MNVRTIQIVNDREELVPYAAELVWGIMHYPNDFLTAYHFQKITSANRILMAAGKRMRASRSLTLFTTDMDKRRGRAAATGLIAALVVQMKHNGIEPSLRKVIDLTSKIISTAPRDIRINEKMPSEHSALKKAISSSEFRPVAHLWAAYSMIGEARHNIFSNQEDLKKLLHLADLLGNEIRSATPNVVWNFLDLRPPVPSDPDAYIFMHSIDQEVSDFLKKYEAHSGGY